MHWDCVKAAIDVMWLFSDTKVNKKANPTNPPNHKSSIISYGALNQKDFLTINDCSQLLNITTVTLRRWIKEGIIETKRLGKKHIIKRDDINRLLCWYMLSWITDFKSIFIRFKPGY